MKQIVSILLAIALTRATCLSSETLASLGFDNTQDAEVIAAPTVCTDLFSSVGACVPEATVKAKLEADNADFADALSGYEAMYTAMIDLQVEILTAAGATQEIIDAATAEVESDKEKCVMAYSTIQQGMTCYAASAAASDNVSSDSEIVININTANAGATLQACNKLVGFTCMFTAGVTVEADTDASISNEGFDFENETRYKDACTNLQSMKDCTTTDCTNSAYDIFINTFFSPYDYTVFPSEEIADKIAKMYDNAREIIEKAMEKAGESTTTETSTSTETKSSLLGQAAKRRFVKRQLAKRKLADKSTVSAKSSTTGADVVTYGGNSGVDKVESGSTYVFSALIALVFAALA